MKDFTIYLNGFCLLVQGSMHLLFLCRFTGKPKRAWHFAVYLFLLGGCAWFAHWAALSAVAAIAMELLILSGVSRFALGNRWPVSLVSALFAVYISQLSFGIVNSVEAMVFPHWIGKPLLYPLLLLATLGAFLICAGCYAALLKLLSMAQGCQTPYLGLLLLPGLFFFTAELYILQTSYTTISTALSLSEAGKHGGLLFLQMLGLGALLSTVYAYRRICQSFQDRAALTALTQAAQAQKRYVAEAQLRYNATRAFRHDINNHLSVLGRLLDSGNIAAAKAYLDPLQTAANALSLPCQTGSPVVDILLGEKLALAASNGIEPSLSLRLPQTAALDDFDLCVIFANAIDNAIQACLSLEGKPFLRIQGQRQGDFYFLKFENSCSPGPLPPRGQGLANVRAVAEKYHGAMTVEKSEGCFCLSVLLNISAQGSDRSAQSPCTPPEKG